MLRSQLWEREQESRRAGEQESRSAIGRSMRAEKIRTYNYPQNRVTDHRIGKSWHNLDKIINGDLGEVVGAETDGVVVRLQRMAEPVLRARGRQVRVWDIEKAP